MPDGTGLLGKGKRLPRGVGKSSSDRVATVHPVSNGPNSAAAPVEDKRLPLIWRGASHGGAGRSKDLASAADTAIAAAVDELRERQFQQGRSRIFGAKRIGGDDLGMVAFKRIIESPMG